MKIFVAVFNPKTAEVYFPPYIRQQLAELGDVRYQDIPRRMTEEEYIQQIGDAEVLITHWGAPKVTAAVLDACPNLKLVAHGTGSVAGIGSDALYERNIPVLSANPILARYVAEAILGHMIHGIRHTVDYDRQMKSGVLNPPEPGDDTLFGASIAFIGLGMVGRHLLNLLAPFQPKVRIFDPYISEDALAAWPFAQRCTTKEETLSGARIVTLNASKTPETFHMMDGAALACLPDGALVINCGRGAVMDTQALIQELQNGRLSAVLDVYEREPLDLASPLRSLDNVVLIPHRAGTPARDNMTQGIVEDLRRYAAGEALQLQVSYNQYKLMTQE